MSLYLNPEHLRIVQAILANHLPGRSVVAFGSRVTGQHKPHSDLDLCIMGDPALTFAQLADLREDFAESDLPMRVDIVEWASLTPAFQTVIKQNHMVIL